MGRLNYKKRKRSAPHGGSLWGDPCARERGAPQIFPREKSALKSAAWGPRVGAGALNAYLGPLACRRLRLAVDMAMVIRKESGAQAAEGQSAAARRSYPAEFMARRVSTPMSRTCHRTLMCSPQTNWRWGNFRAPRVNQRRPANIFG